MKVSSVMINRSAWHSACCNWFQCCGMRHDPCNRNISSLITARDLETTDVDGFSLADETKKVLLHLHGGNIRANATCHYSNDWLKSKAMPTFMLTGVVDHIKTLQIFTLQPNWISNSLWLNQASYSDHMWLQEGEVDKSFLGPDRGIRLGIASVLLHQFDSGPDSIRFLIQFDTD